MRVGYEERRGIFYRTRFWTPLADKPIDLEARPGWGGYTAVMTQFVTNMAANNQLNRVETGYSEFSALLGPVLMAIPTLGALIIALFVITEEPWWGRLMVPLIPTIIFALLAWLGWKRHWPRQLHNIADLKPLLPPVR